MPLTLAAVTPENWEKLIELKLPAEQETANPPNWYALLQANQLQYLAYGIHNDGKLIGLVTIGWVNDTRSYWIHHLMLDADHNEPDHALEAMKLTVRYIRGLPVGTNITYPLPTTLYHPVTNQQLQELGFVPLGEFRGQVIYGLQAPPLPPLPIEAPVQAAPTDEKKEINWERILLGIILILLTLYGYFEVYVPRLPAPSDLPIT
ncbi:hypothetical protein [Deinococcus roseus]|uniref:N-acetyltransferase domain-containing protein n=1 Tax=Deinococcus roseus TaxID=392414 RepID=A0ABQ2CXW3_9DEIO|nr:hypothetical protein [Deinococcus roseus]GGJ31399.1 hypothetical protein GCM10008938_16980 [Deinococcus roseus]